MEVLRRPDGDGDGLKYNLRSRKVLPGPKRRRFAVKKNSSSKSTTARSNKRTQITRKPAAPKLSTHDVTGHISEDDEAISRFDLFATDKSEEQCEAESEYLSRKFARLATRYFNDHRNKEDILEYELVRPLTHEATTLSPTFGLQYHTNFVARPKGESATMDMMFFATVLASRLDYFEVQFCYILGHVESNNGLPGNEACIFCDDVLHPKGWGTTCV